jgi:hypothetical protein
VQNAESLGDGTLHVNSAGFPRDRRTSSWGMCKSEGCTAPALGNSAHCSVHKRVCKHAGCAAAAERQTPYCAVHRGGRTCAHAGGCAKQACCGYSFCATHGGGRRCQVSILFIKYKRNIRIILHTDAHPIIRKPRKDEVTYALGSFTLFGSVSLSSLC